MSQPSTNNNNNNNNNNNSSDPKTSNNNNNMDNKTISDLKKSITSRVSSLKRAIKLRMAKEAPRGERNKSKQKHTGNKVTMSQSDIIAKKIVQRLEIPLFHRLKVILGSYRNYTSMVINGGDIQRFIAAHGMSPSHREWILDIIISLHSNQHGIDNSVSLSKSKESTTANKEKTGMDPLGTPRKRRKSKKHKKSTDYVSGRAMKAIDDGEATKVESYSETKVITPTRTYNTQIKKTSGPRSVKKEKVTYEHINGLNQRGSSSTVNILTLGTTSSISQRNRHKSVIPRSLISTPESIKSENSNSSGSNDLNNSNVSTSHSENSENSDLNTTTSSSGSSSSQGGNSSGLNTSTSSSSSYVSTSNSSTDGDYDD